LRREVLSPWKTLAHRSPRSSLRHAAATIPLVCALAGTARGWLRCWRRRDFIGGVVHQAIRAVLVCRRYRFTPTRPGFVRNRSATPNPTVPGADARTLQWRTSHGVKRDRGLHHFKRICVARRKGSVASLFSGVLVTAISIAIAWARRENFGASDAVDRKLVSGTLILTVVVFVLIRHGTPWMESCDCGGERRRATPGLGGAFRFVGFEARPRWPEAAQPLRPFARGRQSALLAGAIFILGLTEVLGLRTVGKDLGSPGAQCACCRCGVCQFLDC